MKLEEFLERLRLALDEYVKALDEWHNFLIVEMREAAEADEAIDLDRGKRLQARWEEAKERVRKVEELLSEVED